MITEPLTLYKLMILYLLDAVNYPLTNNQLTSFFLDYEYTTYFTLQQAITELEESRLIHSSQQKKLTRYEISLEGVDTLRLFGKDISSGAIEDINKFLKTNKLRLREEASNYTDFNVDDRGNYIFHAEIREETGILFSVDINVPDRESAERMCLKWREKNQPLYAHIMKELLS